MNCPRCHKDKGVERVESRSSLMRCLGCKYEMIDEASDEALGVKRDGDGFINTGDGHEYFYSWYCLKRWKTWEARKTHDDKYHKIGDPMMGMIPSGYTMDFKVECGN